MIRLQHPDYDAGDVFTTCINRIRNTELKNRLECALQAVIDASAEFDEAAAHTRLHLMPRHELVGGAVTQAEMESVYVNRMAKVGAPGRDIYDSLRNSTPQGKCPLCAHRTVSTLDHHLPKAHYPALAVAPLNLVPTCSDCNKAKQASAPTNAENEPLHPYYDDIDADRWLVAEVMHTSPTALRFYVQTPVHWNDVLKSRVHTHFRVFGLAKLYATEAADELLSIRHQLKTLHEKGGPAIVQAELQDRAESCEYARRNGWRTATYRALATSEWFCDCGFI